MVVGADVLVAAPVAVGVGPAVGWAVMEAGVVTLGVWEGVGVVLVGADVGPVVGPLEGPAVPARPTCVACSGP